VIRANALGGSVRPRTSAHDVSARPAIKAVWSATSVQLIIAPSEPAADQRIRPPTTVDPVVPRTTVEGVRSPIRATADHVVTPPRIDGVLAASSEDDVVPVQRIDAVLPAEATDNVIPISAR